MEIVLRKFFKVLPDFCYFFFSVSISEVWLLFNVFVVKKGHQCLLLNNKRFPDYNELLGCTRG